MNPSTALGSAKPFTHEFTLGDIPVVCSFKEYTKGVAFVGFRYCFPVSKN